jgi:hypothetical protein
LLSFYICFFEKQVPKIIRVWNNISGKLTREKLALVYRILCPTLVNIDNLNLTPPHDDTIIIYPGGVSTWPADREGSLGWKLPQQLSAERSPE